MKKIVYKESTKLEPNKETVKIRGKLSELWPYDDANDLIGVSIRDERRNLIGVIVAVTPGTDGPSYIGEIYRDSSVYENITNGSIESLEIVVEE